MPYPPSKDIDRLVRMMKIRELTPKIRQRRRRFSVLQEYEGADSIMIWRQ